MAAGNSPCPDAAVDAVWTAIEAMMTTPYHAAGKHPIQNIAAVARGFIAALDTISSDATHMLLHTWATELSGDLGGDPDLEAQVRAQLARDENDAIDALVSAYDEICAQRETAETAPEPAQ